MKLQRAAGDGSSPSGADRREMGEVGANMASMSDDVFQPSEDEVADQVMEDAEGGVESSTLDAPDDEPNSAEPD